MSATAVLETSPTGRGLAGLAQAKRERPTTNSYDERPSKTALEGEAFPWDAVSGMTDLTKFDTSDAGNAEAFMLLHGRRFLWCDALGGWLQFNGTHWTKDRADAELDAAIENLLEQRRLQGVALERTANSQLEETSEAGSADKEIKAQRLLAKAQNLIESCRRDTRKINNIKPRIRQRVIALAEEFDQSPDHLNAANGVLDLSTGELEQHSPAQRFTYCLSVPYDPQADRTAWTVFLAQVMVDDPEVLPFLQEAVGYSLTGRISEEKLFYLYGPDGRNGKGVFTEVLKALLGKPLATEAEFSTFTRDRDNDAQNFDLAPLKPARFIAASESKKEERLNETKIKQATGGNEIYCAHKNKPHFTYQPQFKIWLSSNYDVNADPTDQAVWGRVVRILFPHTFEGREDRGLKARLKWPENLMGVLAWAVEGAMRWYAKPNGLQVPESLRIGAQEVREELDTLQQWLDAATITDADAWASTEALRASYEAWCKANGVRYPKQARSFGIELKAKGFLRAQKGTGSGKVWGYRGLELIAKGLRKPQD